MGTGQKQRTEHKNKAMKKIENYNIKTAMGKLNIGKLPFLTEKELSEFNTIGYTGRDSSGKVQSYESYLNGLGKGEFKVEKTKRDNGDFTEGFNITRVTLQEEGDIDPNEVVKELETLKFHLSGDLANPNAPNVIEDAIKLIERKY